VELGLRHRVERRHADGRQPGRAADFDSTRQFDLKFAGGLSSLGSAAASEAAPLSSDLAQNLGDVFKVGDVAGLGDAAFMGPGTTIYAVKATRRSSSRSST